METYEDGEYTLPEKNRKELAAELSALKDKYTAVIEGCCKKCPDETIRCDGYNIKMKDGRPFVAQCWGKADDEMFEPMFNHKYDDRVEHVAFWADMCEYLTKEIERENERRHRLLQQ